MDNLDAFLEVECAIRSGKITRAEQITLPQYWRDLSLVLLRHADAKYDRGIKVLEENFDQIGNQFYKNFFIKRPKVLPSGESQKLVQNNLDLGDEQANAN